MYKKARTSTQTYKHIFKDKPHLFDMLTGHGTLSGRKRLRYTCNTAKLSIWMSLTTNNASQVHRDEGF